MSTSDPIYAYQARHGLPLFHPVTPSYFSTATPPCFCNLVCGVSTRLLDWPNENLVFLKLFRCLGWGNILVLRTPEESQNLPCIYCSRDLIWLHHWHQRPFILVGWSILCRLAPLNTMRSSKNYPMNHCITFPLRASWRSDTSF